MLSYAEERAANIARNRQMLAALDVEKLKPSIEPKETRHKARPATKPKPKPAPTVRTKRKADTDVYSDASESDVGSELDADADMRPRTKKTARVVSDENAAPGSRRSSRIARKGTDALVRVENARGTPQPISVKKVRGAEPSSRKNGRRYNPKTYGAIPGVDVGSWWASREECAKDSIHAPWVGGIAPGPDGAYSIALSGGYDDDIDDGYAFTYTGAGGRDLRGTKTAPKNLRTAAQSFDQSFENRNNKSLQRSVETGKPVRVIRGFKLRSKYGPSEGYRYDGLYVVKKAWQDKGLNKGGFLVCKFAFVRLPNQPPIPVKRDADDDDMQSANAINDEESDADAEGEADQTQTPRPAKSGTGDEVSGGETDADAEGETVSEE